MLALLVLYIVNNEEKKQINLCDLEGDLITETTNTS